MNTVALLLGGAKHVNASGVGPNFDPKRLTSSTVARRVTVPETTYPKRSSNHVPVICTETL